ncbi:MAG: DNA repair protein RecO [Pseudomonadota bacterium]
MSQTKRVEGQAAYILHRRPFRDSSQILDLFSRDHGRVSVVARGSRGARSKLKGVLRPFMRLNVGWVQRTDLGTLTGAEVGGAPLSLAGDALLSGYYVNELLLNFLHRHDEQPDIFELYASTIHALAADSSLTAVLRNFEMELLGAVGYALITDVDTTQHQPLRADQHYEYRFEAGPVAVQRSEGALVFSGATLQAIGERQFDQPAVLRSANRLLREVIAFHLGGKELKSRKVLVDLHKARMPTTNVEAS